MTNIIQFEPRRSRQAPRGGATEMAATLLFFTGVRYERQPEQAVSSKTAARPGRLASRSGVAKTAQKRAPDYHDDTPPIGRGRRG